MKPTDLFCKTLSKCSQAEFIFHLNMCLRSSLERKSAFVDRDEAKLVLELEVAIQASPKFEIERFDESLQSKDMYGNGTVSRQHVIQVR